MSRDDDNTPTPPMRPSSMKISQWGIAQAWLAGERNGRMIVVNCDDEGNLSVAAIDMNRELTVRRSEEVVSSDEDVSRAAVRALSKLK